MKRLLQSLFLLLFFASVAIAQERTVTGKITAADDGLPLPGVSVKVKGTTIGTITNADGNYSINVPTDGETLVFSYIGYTQKETSIGSRTQVNITLGVDTKQLGEVVVTALGISRSSKSLGYAVDVVSGKELTKARETNIVNALSGKVAGVRITSSSGGVGGSAKIIIRGATSLGTDLQPIFVIDGLPVDNGAQQLATVGGVPQGTASVDFGNRASDINPDDIESISVLKGAAATALYGARAKNGAIIISTKKGSKGQGSVTFNSSVRFDNVLKFPEYQNEFAQGNQGLYSIANTNGWGPKISDVQDKTFVNFLGNLVNLKAYPNNVSDFYKTGNTYINSIAMEGGGESGDYRFGYTSTVQNGTIEGQTLNKNFVSLNAGRNLIKGLDVRTNINYVRTVGDGLAVQSSNNPNVLTPLIYGLPRTVDINELKANSIDPVTKQQITLTPGKTGNNPYWIINNNKFGNVVNRLYGNAIVTLKPVSWLTISDNFGTDYYNEFRKGTTRPGTIGALTGNFFTGNIYNRLINNDLIATTNFKLTKDIDLKVIGGYNIYETYYQREQSDAQGLTVDELYTFSNAAAVNTTNTSNKKRIMGLYGDIGLSYKDFFFLEATGRNDWSSALPVSNRSYFYPSVSTSFVFSELISNNKWLSYGKLRASYANVGSDTDPYSLAFNYTAVNSAFAQYGYGSVFPFNGVLGFSIPGTIPPLDNLKPQNQRTFEMGSELKFLNNRISADLTYYNSNTSDQIISLSLPNSTGFAAKLINAGSLKNQGVELQLGIVPVKTRNLTWDFDINYSKNKQTVELPSEVALFTVASGWSGLQIKAENGKSIAIYGVAWERDPAGNIVIDANTGLRKTKADQRLGQVAPEWMMGINNSLSFKGFNLGFLVDIRQGGVIYSNTVSALRTSGLSIETAANRGNIFIDKGVIKTGTTYTENTVPVQSMQDFWGQFSTANTEANIFDASYVKLREVKFSYAISPQYLAKHVKFLKSAEIGVEARNLWIIHDNVPFIDPEVNFFGPASAGEGVEFNTQPSTRTYGFNLRVKI